MNLINAKLCPTWVLPSTAILGRCLPLGNMAGKDKNETIVTPDEAEDGKGVTAGTVTKAVSRLGAFLGLREFVEKVGNDLADTYWMIGVALIGSTVTSFIWIILMRFFHRHYGLGQHFLAFCCRRKHPCLQHLQIQMDH